MRAGGWLANLCRGFVSLNLMLLVSYTQASVGSAETHGQSTNPAAETQNYCSDNAKDCALDWKDCAKLAEANLSERNILFMLRAKRLINKNTGFLGHSKSTQQLFCAEISRCEAAHKRQYSNNEYPSCNDK